MTTAALKALIARYRIHSECVGVALFATLVFVSLGLKLQRDVAPGRVEVRRLTASSTEISTFKSAFRPSTAEQDLRIGALPDSLSIAMPREMRFSLAEAITARAELSGLSGVRVRFASPDSTPPPAVPALTNTTVKVADYTIGIDCSGGFAAVLSLVNHLPPSVALQRLTVQRTKGGTQYHLTFAVFETSGSTQHG